MTPTPSRYTDTGPIFRCDIDVKRHPGIHNYPFKCLGTDPIGINKSFTDLPHTPANTQLKDAGMVFESITLSAPLHLLLCMHEYLCF